MTRAIFSGGLVVHPHKVKTRADPPMTDDVHLAKYAVCGSPEDNDHSGWSERYSIIDLRFRVPVPISTRFAYPRPSKAAGIFALNTAPIYWTVYNSLKPRLHL